jgi:ferredoxin--NADP+ reductase
MTFVITQRCCNDASCVPVCPVNCIHPAPGEPGYLTTEMLYIDPETCIECSACVQVCPVDAIKDETDLLGSEEQFLEINAAFYARHPLSEFGEAEEPKRVDIDVRGLRVAIVGSGPAGSYAAAALLERPGVEVDLYERQLTPYGLVRFGIAPDHQQTKKVVQAYPYGAMRGLRLRLGVAVGTDVTHEELLRHYHAVIYAVGAGRDRRLDVPGEDLPGSYSAADFVAWYNGHPDSVDLPIDLSSVRRAVIIGNGNVALDVARVLACDPERLGATDIADHALKVLRDSAVTEVVVVGRRGAAQAAFTNPELLDLLELPGVEVVVDPDDLTLDQITAEAEAAGELPVAVERKLAVLRRIAAGNPAQDAERGRRRIVLRFLASPSAVLGEEHVEGVALVRNELVAEDGGLRAVPAGEPEVLDAQLVLRSIGYLGSPVPDLPFDSSRGTVPHDAGRVRGEDGDMPGVYVTGWIKRGPTGVVGTNKHCAGETVATLLADWTAGRLAPPVGTSGQLDELLATRQVCVFGLAEWSRIDAAERAAGSPAGRPRVKLVTTPDLVAAASSAE